MLGCIQHFCDFMARGVIDESMQSLKKCLNNGHLSRKQQKREPYVKDPLKDV